MTNDDKILHNDKALQNQITHVDYHSKFWVGNFDYQTNKRFIMFISRYNYKQDNNSVPNSNIDFMSSCTISW